MFGVRLVGAGAAESLRLDELENLGAQISDGRRLGMPELHELRITDLIDGKDPMRADADTGRTAVDVPLNDVGDLARRSDPQADPLERVVPVERLFVSGRADLVDVVFVSLGIQRLADWYGCGYYVTLASFVLEGVDHEVGTVGAVIGHNFSGLISSSQAPQEKLRQVPQNQKRAQVVDL